MCKRVAMMMAYVNAAYSMYNKKEVIFFMYGYIYQIENLINHKLYIGYTTLTPEKR